MSFFRGFHIAGDLTLTDDYTDLVLWRGVDMVEQQIRDGAEIWTGTIGWDPEKGLPMLGGILVKGPDFRVLQSVFRDFLLETDGVIAVNSLDLSLDKISRRLTVNFSVTAEDGEELISEISFTVV